MPANLMFHIKNDKIPEFILIFDSRDFFSPEKVTEPEKGTTKSGCQKSRLNLHSLYIQLTFL